MFWKRKENTLTPVRDYTLALDDTFIAILLQMDQQDLLVSAQRVCKRWYHIIHHTAAIRRHLFFDISDISTTRSKHRILNPLLVKAFPSLFEDTTLERCTAETTVRRERERTLFTGTELYKKMDQPGIWRRRKRRKGGKIKLEDELAAQERTNPFLRKDASWLRMHVSDPPVRRVCVQYIWKWIYYSDAVRDKRHFAVQIGGQGLCMGDLYSSMMAVAPWAYADGLLWPLHVPDAQDTQQCEMVISDPWNRVDTNEDCYEAHAEPDLVVATTEAYGYSFHSRDDILNSVGEMFCHEHLVKKQYGNFIGPEAIKRFPKRGAVDLGLPLWVRRRFGWQQVASP